MNNTKTALSSRLNARLTFIKILSLVSFEVNYSF